LEYRPTCDLSPSSLPAAAESRHSRILTIIGGGGGQGRNHVFKAGGPILWSMVLLPFYRKKLDKSTQFGAVGYINAIYRYSSKSYVKKLGDCPDLEGPEPSRPPVVAPMVVLVVVVVDL